MANKDAIGLAHPHFSWQEVVCRCCGSVILDARFWQHMGLLEQLRTWWGAPLSINSGHRCPKHNAEEGGAEKSQHLHFATDIRPSLRSPRIQAISGTEERLRTIAVAMLADQAEKLGFKGIGYYPTFLHLDLREGEKAQWGNAELT